MKITSDSDSSWPVALIGIIMAGFIMGATPAGQKISSETLTSLRSTFTTAGPTTPARPRVLLVSSSLEYRSTTASVVSPRGYSVMVARSEAVAEGLLDADSNAISIVILDMQMANADRITRLVQSSAPTAKLIRLYSKHKPAELSTLLMDAI